MTWHDSPTDPNRPPPGSRSIDRILRDARARLDRLGPSETLALLPTALLIDIRPQAQRAEFGVVPQALTIERNVLEWRLDPRSAHRIPQMTGYHLTVVVMCQEGYTSSLAATALQELGLHRATDMTGGFRAWRLAGLPIEDGIGRSGAVS